jgi:putative membrane protein
MPHLQHEALVWLRSVLPILLLLMALIYLRGWLSLRSNGLKSVSVWRAASFLVGLLLICVAMASPIATLDHEFLTVHMLQHLLLMTFAPPLIWLGAPLRPILCGLPRRFVESLPVLLRRLRLIRTLAKAAVRPRFAWLAACATLVGWHIPIFFALGMRSAGWHLFEQLSFLATGLLFWWPVVQPESASRHDLSMILYLFFATLPCDILSGILVFSERVAYPMHFSSSHRLGFSPLEDQQCAAALMWTCVTIVYLLAGSILTMRILSPQEFAQGGVAQAESFAPAIPRHASEKLVSQSIVLESVVSENMVSQSLEAL